jgi:hypothetical protein
LFIVKPVGGYNFLGYGAKEPQLFYKIECGLNAGEDNKRKHYIVALVYYLEMVEFQINDQRNKKDWQTWNQWKKLHLDMNLGLQIPIEKPLFKEYFTEEMINYFKNKPLGKSAAPSDERKRRKFK